MLQKALLVGLSLLLLLGAGVLLLANDRGDPELGGPTAADASAPRATPAAATEASGDAGTAGGEPEAVERATAAVHAEATQRPVRDDAGWIVVKIVDELTGTPLPGAVVHWHDETSWDYHRERQPDADQRDHELNWHGERLADLAGWRTRSDGQGLARVTVKEWSVVSAQHGTLYGKLRLQANTVPPIGGHVVELRADATVTVRVVDERGAPCADVPVTVAVLDKDKNQVGNHGSAAFARSDADGLARIGHTPELTAHLFGPWTEPGTTFETRVRLLLAGHPDPGVAFDAAAPPADPIELRLPACGSAVVRAEIGGKPVPGFRTAWMSVERDEPRNERNWHGELRVSSSATVGPDGAARFPFVPLGQQYRFGVDALGGADTVRSGPINAGQQIDVVLGPRDDAMLLTGTLLGPDRQPLVRQQVIVQLTGPGLRNHNGVRTGDDGRFVLSAGSPRKENRADQITFVHRPKGQPARRGEVAGRTLRPGLEELGEIVLGEGVTIVSGRLVARGEPWRQRTTLRVERWEPADERRPARWRRVDGTFEHQDGTGAFSIRGTAAPGRHRLSVAASNVLPIEPIEFVPGASDLVVEVDPGHGLAASVLLPDGATAEFVTAVLVPAVAPPPRPVGDGERGGEDRLKRQLSSGRRARHHVAWPAIPDGTYTLELRLWAYPKPLLVVPDVVLPVPAGGDARLAELDLRPLLRVVTLALHEADGRTPVDGNTIVFPAAQASPAEWLGFEVWSRRVRLLLPQGGYDLLVATRGFRPQPARGEGAELAVRLDRWPTLAVRVPEIPKLPERARVTVALQAAQPSDLKYRTPWSSGDASEYLQPPRRSIPVANGVATVAIGDGLHTLRLTVTANRRSHALDGFEPRQVLPTVGEVVVTVPAEHWKQAVDVVSQPPPAGSQGRPAPEFLYGEESSLPGR
jgi:hypothetical protein